MNRKNHLFRHIVYSEWRRICKTPIQLVLVIAVPFVLMLFLLWGIHTVRASTTNYDGRVYCQTEEQRDYASTLLEKYPSFDSEVGDIEVAKSDVHHGHPDIALVVSADNITAIYDSNLLSSSNALKDASNLGTELSFFLESEETHEHYLASQPETIMVNLSTEVELLDNVLDQVIGVVGMILFLSMASNAMTMSSHAITGEKERQTFDTLVLCPTPLHTVLGGKILVIGTQIFLAGFMGCLGTITGLYLWARDDFQLIARSINGRATWILVLLALLLSTSMLITGIFAIISAAFPETKKTALFGSLGMVVVSFASMIPSFTHTSILKYIPITNFSLLMKDACKSQIQVAPVLGSIGIAILVSILCVILSRRLWERSHE